MLIILLFVLLIVAQSGKKFVLDEIDFPIVAKATSETAIPIYYRGEMAQTHIGIGIYHPPLYINSLALFIKIFGYNENTIRMFGMLCALLSAYIICLIYNKLVSDEKKQGVFETIFLSLFLLHPYTIANATLPDIDSTVLPVTISLFFFLLIKFFQRPASCFQDIKSARRELLIMGGVFSIILWAKLTTPLILPFFALLLLIVFGYSFRVAFLFTAVISLLGSIFFLASYWIYCFFLELPFAYTFQFLLQSFTKGTAESAGLIEKIMTNLFYAKFFIYWLTIPFLLLFLICAFSLTKKELTSIEKVVLILGSLAVFVTSFYLCLISPFGGFFKYPFAAFSFFAFVIAFFISDTIDFNKRINKILFIMGILIISVMESHFYGDIFFKSSLASEFASNITAINMTLLIVIAFSFSFIVKRFRQLEIVKYSLLVILSIAVGFNVGISRSQALSDYPTKYHYGQTGFNETVSYLKAKVNHYEVIWSMKDIGYYVNNKYIENYRYFFDDQLLNDLVKIISNKKVRYFVVTTDIGQDRIDAYPKIASILEQYCVKDKTFGNFVIYRAKASE